MIVDQNNKQRTLQLFFWVFTISVVFILTLPTLVQDGMFMDGVLYSAVSHNLANGLGTFWFPTFSYNNLAGIRDSFHEQPPLVFGIQALFYKVFGDSMYVERFYVFITILFNIFLIKNVWETIYKENEEYKKLAWLPVLLWISIPVCFWSYSNNMHENTVSIFVLAAVLFQLKAIKAKQGKAWFYIIISGLFIFLASFAKGIPGLFPIMVPMVFTFKNQLSIKKAIMFSSVLFLIVAVIYGLILLNNNAKQSLSNYFFLRLLKRVNDIPTTASYFETLWRLLQECIGLILLTIILKLSIKKTTTEDKKTNTLGITFLAIGLTGVLPLMLTLVQKGFYMVPALPFIAIGFSILIVSLIHLFITQWVSHSKFITTLKLLTIALALVSIILPVLKIGKYSREEEKLKDIHYIGSILPHHEVINCSHDLLEDWSLQTYLSRYYYMSLDINSKHTYFLCSKTEFESSSKQLSKNYTILPTQLKDYCLLKTKINQIKTTSF